MGFIGGPMEAIAGDAVGGPMAATWGHMKALWKQ